MSPDSTVARALEPSARACSSSPRTSASARAKPAGVSRSHEPHVLPRPRARSPSRSPRFASRRPASRAPWPAGGPSSRRSSCSRDTGSATTRARSEPAAHLVERQVASRPRRWRARRERARAIGRHHGEEARRRAASGRRPGGARSRGGDRPRSTRRRRRGHESVGRNASTSTPNGTNSTGTRAPRSPSHRSSTSASCSL